MKNNSVYILLSTYNGERYLKEQLDSLYNQTYKKFKIIVRDDNSTDNTFEILKSYDVKIIPSENNLGAKKSFATLLEYALTNTDAEYFMFCDQDDIWETGKIEKTVKKMKELKKRYENIPLLVHSDLKVVDEKLTILNNSFWDYEKINPLINNFHNLLMQNTITGCTMMINRRLAELASPIPNDSVMHDAWLGLVVSCFGKIGIVNEQTIQYRQHSTNSVGTNGVGIQYIVDKILQKDILQKNILQAKVFLDIYRNDLDAPAINMLEEFSSIQTKSFFTRRKILLKYKLFKQGLIRNIGMMVKI